MEQKMMFRMNKSPKRKYTDDTFREWLISERFNVILAVLCAFLPLLISFVNDIMSVNAFSGRYSELRRFFDHNVHYQVCNLIFIIIALCCLSRMRYIRDKDSDKAGRLHEYVRDVFGQNSTLAKDNTAPVLFSRISSGIKQFYYSWITLWVLWLILYMEKLIFTLYSMYCTDESTLVCMFRVDNFIENNLNLLSSFVSFFIYMDITMSTVKVGTLGDRGRHDMQTGVMLLILFAVIFVVTDMFSIFVVSHDTYDKIQFVLRLFIGVIATISVMAVLGRLNTSYLRIPQYIIMILYLYATVQMCYPMMYRQEASYVHAEMSYESKNISVCKECKGQVTQRKGCLCECASDAKPSRKCVPSVACCSRVSDCPTSCCTCGRILPESHAVGKCSCSKLCVSNMISPDTRYDIIKIMTNIVSFLAFVGKLALLVMLLWISKKDRFTFFILHKANSLSDTEQMLKRFGEYYGDKDEYGI